MALPGFCKNSQEAPKPCLRTLRRIFAVLIRQQAYDNLDPSGNRSFRMDIYFSESEKFPWRSFFKIFRGTDLDGAS